MDKGLRVGSWGQLQGQLSQPPYYILLTTIPTISYVEWKVDMDSPTDTHRHLSHLIGVSELALRCVTQLKKYSYTQAMLLHHMNLLSKGA